MLSVERLGLNFVTSIGYDEQFDHLYTVCGVTSVFLQFYKMLCVNFMYSVFGKCIGENLENYSNSYSKQRKLFT